MADGIEAFIRAQDAEATLTATKYGHNLLERFMVSKGDYRDAVTVPPEELNDILCHMKVRFRFLCCCFYPSFFPRFDVQTNELTRTFFVNFGNKVPLVYRKCPRKLGHF